MSTSTKPKIYLFCLPSAWPPDVLGYAVTEDGVLLANHLSSNEGFSRHDMGLTSDWKHDIYDRHYPDGYELVWSKPPKDLRDQWEKERHPEDIPITSQVAPGG